MLEEDEQEPDSAPTETLPRADDRVARPSVPTTAEGPSRRGAAEPQPFTGGAIEQFTVEEQLGAGGMGEVYRATDNTLRRRVALKVMRRAGMKQAARLLREAQAMAKLSHPNVVTVYQAGTIGEQVYIAMELADGGTLRDWLSAKRRPWRAIVEMYERAGAGLAAAHAAGLVHRDFKPANVLIDDSGAPRVTDFGLVTSGPGDDPSKDGAPEEAHDALLGAALTETGQAMGTPLYMSPEQHRRDPVDERSDQFSFCASLFEALHGSLPFPGTTVEEIASRALRGEIVWPDGPRVVPRWLDRVLTRGLRPNSEDRYPTMDALLDALATGRRRRRRAVVAGAAIATVIAAVAALAATRRADRVCANAAEELGPAWDRARIAKVERAFRGSPADWRSVKAALDAYAQRWMRSHEHACRATRVHGHQTEEVLTARMQCLDRHRRSLDAFTSLLATADEELVRRAPQAVQTLSTLEDCDDAAALTAVIPPPDAETRAAVQALAEPMARVEALTRAGDYDRALALAAQLVETAEQLGYAPAIAEAQLKLGVLQATGGKNAEADAAYRASARYADEGRHDAARVRALTRLARLHGVIENETETGHQYVRDARSALARLGPRAGLESQLLRIEGAIYEVEGKYAEALELHRQATAALPDDERNGYEHAQLLRSTASVLGELGRHVESLEDERRALAIIETVIGGESVEAARIIDSMAVSKARLGMLEEALALAQRALALKQARLPEDHPSLGYSHMNIGATLRRLKRYDEALSHLRQAADIHARSVGQDHPLVARVRTSIGTILLLSDRPAEAAPELERALSALEHHPNPHPEDVAIARHQLAAALVATRGDRGRACALARAALAYYAGQGASGDEGKATVEAWMRGACKGG